MPIRPYRDGDEAQLVALFASVFGRAIDEAHWRWKLAHATPQVPNVLLAMSGERPVFQYAGIPTVFSLRGARAHAMVSVDTMTAPDFRRRGLLTRVATEAYQCWRAAGVDFVFGLPNEQWGSRAAALGWLPLFKLQRLARPLRPEALLAHRLSMPWLRRLSFASTVWNGLVARKPARDPAVRTQLVTDAGEEFDRLWERCSGDADFAVVRDRRWVQWRFLACPSRKFQVRLAMRGNTPAGYCAYSVTDSDGRRRATLAELVAPRSDAAVRDALLADLLDELQAQQVEFVTTLAVPGTSIYQWLRRSNFFGGPAFSVEMVPLAEGLPVDAMRQAERWDLSGAAFDVV